MISAIHRHIKALLFVTFLASCGGGNNSSLPRTVGADVPLTTPPDTAEDSSRITPDLIRGYSPDNRGTLQLILDEARSSVNSELGRNPIPEYELMGDPAVNFSNYGLKYGLADITGTHTFYTVETENDSLMARTTTNGWYFSGDIHFGDNSALPVLAYSLTDGTSIEFEVSESELKIQQRSISNEFLAEIKYFVEDGKVLAARKNANQESESYDFLPRINISEILSQEAFFEILKEQSSLPALNVAEGGNSAQIPNQIARSISTECAVYAMAAVAGVSGVGAGVFGLTALLEGSLAFTATNALVAGVSLVELKAGIELLKLSARELWNRSCGNDIAELKRSFEEFTSGLNGFGDENIVHEFTSGQEFETVFPSLCSGSENSVERRLSLVRFPSAQSNCTFSSEEYFSGSCISAPGPLTFPGYPDIDGDGFRSWVDFCGVDFIARYNPAISSCQCYSF